MGSMTEADSDAHTRIRQQEVLADLGQQALESDDLDQLMHDAAVAVAETLDNEYAKVLELLPGGDAVFLRQGVGWREGLVGSATVPTDRDSQAGYTLCTEEAVVVDDLRTDERFSGPELLTNHDVVSGISVVIGSVEEPWGVLGTHTTDRREFTEHDANFVQSIANVLAAAIDRVDTEQQLREREAQLNVATDAASIGLWRWDIEADVVIADEFLAEAYGMDTAAAEAGASMEAFYDPIHEDDMQETWAELERALETGELNAEFRVRNDDGDVMWVVARGEVDYGPDGEPIRMHGAITDITERKRREQALEERERRYRDLFTSMTEGYCVIEKVDATETDPLDFRYVEANPAFKEHAGVDDVVGKTIRDVVPGEPPEWFETYERVVETGEPVRFERELVTQGRALECFAFPVGTEADEQVGVLFTDVTERVERERRLEELIDRLETSNERLEQFAYAASHDLQEPLRMVSSYLQLIDSRAGDELSGETEEFLDYAIDGADRMRSMIDGLLQYSRVETRGQPLEAVDLGAIVDDVRADLGVRISATDATVTVEELPRVVGDENQLQQLFQNLLKNAIEYSGDDAPRIHISAERTDSRWTVSVRDEGIGIDPAYHDQVFEIFHRLHSQDDYPGSGIGLALCERIVERHGGEIWVESTPGEGATFRFTLPAVEDQADE